MSTPLVKVFKYALLLCATVLSVLLDYSFFKEISFLRPVRLSLILCVCLSLYQHDERALYFSGGCGFLCDLYTLSLPHFSILYLYISLGCVWCESMFLNFTKKSIFLCGLAVFFAYEIATLLLNFFTTREICLSPFVLRQGIAFILVNSALTPIVYLIVKRAKL